jgi:hypothetical protein
MCSVGDLAHIMSLVVRLQKINDDITVFKLFSRIVIGISIGIIAFQAADDDRKSHIYARIVKTVIVSGNNNVRTALSTVLHFHRLLAFQRMSIKILLDI